MKKIFLILLAAMTIASTALATEGKVKVGTVIKIEFIPASTREEVTKEWRGHTLVTRKVIEVNDDEYAVTVLFENGETEIVYYDIDDFNIKVGDKLEID